MKKIILFAVIFLIILAGLYFLFSQKEKEAWPSLETKFLLYYYNPELDKDESGNVFCSRAGLVPVERKIPNPYNGPIVVPPYTFPIEDAIRLLIKGELTDEERAGGISTEFPLEGFSLKKISFNFKDDILTLEFEDLNNKTGGGACRAGILWFQIEATAKQFFPRAKEVKFLPEELFQP